LEGVWRAEYAGFSGEITIPGTLDESGIGHEDVGTNSWHPDQVPGNGAARGGTHRHPADPQAHL